MKEASTPKENVFENENGVEFVAPPKNSFELFSSKHKIEIESDIPFSTLIQKVNNTWDMESQSTASTKSSTAVSHCSWHAYMLWTSQSQH